jgi:hypothetical protein
MDKDEIKLFPEPGELIPFKAREKEYKDEIKLFPEPGELIPFKAREKEYKKIMGDKEIIKKEWEKIENIANRFIWAVLTDF